MNSFLTLLLVIFLSIRSIQTVNNRKLSLISLGTPEPGDAEGPDDGGDAPKPGEKKGASGIVETVKGLFYSKDKTSTKVKNNMLVMELEDFKNVRGKKAVDNTHLQVQKSSGPFTNNAEKGLLHFVVDKNKVSGKGGINRATFKLTKMFDAKILGFKCTSNAVNLYLVDDPGEDMKLKVLKGPIKLEFKKNDLEVDVTKFFQDLEDTQEGPGAPAGASLLQFTDLTPGKGDSDDLEFDDPAPATKGSGGDDEFFSDEGAKEGKASEDDTPAVGGGVVNKYLMLEADNNCYFAFDVDKNKPRVKLDMTKKSVTTTKGKLKTASVGGGIFLCLILVAGGVIAWNNRKKDSGYELLSNTDHDYLNTGP